MKSTNCAKGSLVPAASPSHNGCTQEELFDSKLGLTQGYVAVAPFGGGKSSLARMEIKRISDEVNRTGQPTYVIVCLWQGNSPDTDCPTLIQQYEKFASELPACDNLQIKVCTKSELEKDYKLSFGCARSTNELNLACKAITDVEDRDVYLIVDEMRVEYILQKGYRFKSSPNELVGNMPFIHKGALYPWSSLLPGKIRLLIFVIPESEFYKERDKIKKLAPTQGPIQTFFLPRNLRTTQRQHQFLTFMENKMESHVKQYGGFLLPPSKEICNRKSDGQQPEWIPVQQTDHLLCQIGCTSCLLMSILPSLAAKMRELADLDKVVRSEVAMVILGIFSDAEKERARTWMKGQFPDIVIYMAEEMVGIEMPIVISIGNVNLHTLITGVREVLPIVVSNAWDMPPESIEQLSLNLDLGNTYRDLMNRKKEATRGEVVETLLENWISGEEGVSLLRLKIALRAETVKLDKIVVRIETALHAELESGVQQMKKLIINDFFNPAEIQNIAFEFGFMHRLLDISSNPKNHLTEKMALIRCLEMFVDQSSSDFSSKDLSDKLKEMNLPDAANEVVVSTKHPMPGNVANIIDHSSDITKNAKKPYELSIFNVALPGIVLMFTLAMIYLLRRKGLYLESGLICLFMWIPSLPVLLFHILEQLDNYFMIISKKKMLLILFLFPISEIAAFMDVMNKQKNFQGKTMRLYYLLKMLDLAKIMQICTLFTSLSMVIMILILLNIGKLTLEFTAVNAVSVLCGMFHIFNLMVTTIRPWYTSSNLLIASLFFFSLSSSVILRILPAILFLSSEFTPFAFCMTAVLVTILPINYILEWQLSKGDWDATAVDDIKSKPTIWFRAAISCIFPLPPKELTKRSLILKNLQLLISNTVCSILIILNINFTTPEPSSWIMPINFLSSIPITSLILTLHVTVTYGITTFILTKLETEGESTDDEREIRDDVTVSSSTALLNEDNLANQRKKRIFIILSLWALFCLSSLIASLSTAPILMMTMFNTCPVLKSSSHSNVTCDNTNPIPHIGTTCTLSCTEGYPSYGSLSSTCSWIGEWTAPLGCSSIPSILILGEEYLNDHRRPNAAQLFNPDNQFRQNISVQPLPYDVLYAIYGYIDGAIITCGGTNQIETREPLSCYTLSRKNSWVESASLPSECVGAASAVVHQGTALWVLGGMDKDDYAYNTTIILQNDQWRWGPNVTSPRSAACAVTLNNGDVILTGGNNNTNMDTVERFSFNSMKWTSLPRLNHPRFQHRCTHIWMGQDGIIKPSINKDSVSSVIIAGGVTFDKKYETYHRVTSVEMLYGNDWIILTHLPSLPQYGVMSLPTALQWRPGYGLFLIGGCFVDYSIRTQEYCTSLVWELQWHGGTPPDVKYSWIKWDTELDTGFYSGNSIISVPWNFFN